MSIIRVNTINSRSGLGTIFVNDSGALIPGITTATTLSGTNATITNTTHTNLNVTGVTTSSSAIIGSGVTITSGGLNVTGIITATGLTGVELTNYSENLYAFGNTGATPSFTLRNGNFITATLSANITSMTFDLTGCPTTTAAFAFTLLLYNDATAGRTITWPAAVRWPNATVPTRTTTASRADVYTFFTTDGGTVWYGNLSLYNYV